LEKEEEERGEERDSVCERGGRGVVAQGQFRYHNETIGTIPYINVFFWPYSFCTYTAPPNVNMNTL
jgi:hypothetical protein